MLEQERDTLELLKFELKFLEDGGYGRSPRTPWRPPYIFEDSPSCPNLGDPARTQRAEEDEYARKPFEPEVSSISGCRNCDAGRPAGRERENHLRGAIVQRLPW